MKQLKLNSKNIHWKIISAIYFLFLSIILVLAYTGKLPSQLVKIPCYDTFLHFILYGIATYLGHRALQKRQLKLKSISLPLWPLLFGIFTITEECLQSLSPLRTFSLQDMIASIVGLICGYLLAEKSKN
ncbi:MAG: VanZ family protein [Xenococcaceae cyanobacterium]